MKFIFSSNLCSYARLYSFSQAIMLKRVSRSERKKGDQRSPPGGWPESLGGASANVFAFHELGSGYDEGPVVSIHPTESSPPCSSSSQLLSSHASSQLSSARQESVPTSPRLYDLPPCLFTLDDGMESAAILSRPPPSPSSPSPS